MLALESGAQLSLVAVRWRDSRWSSVTPTRCLASRMGEGEVDDVGGGWCAAQPCGGMVVSLLPGTLFDLTAGLTLTPALEIDTPFSLLAGW